ncbi:wall-associated receptor kinase 1-like [Hordeum vulgare subsp. vulgare]|nr:wall-associated receptor kinase 1-like [Hordeum vulgare subsp. vulgare]
MSAWRLRPLMLVLFLFLFLLSVMPRSAFSGRLAPPPLGMLPLPVVRNITCNSIKYPFGVKGKAQQPGFEVTCGRNNEAMLQIDKHSYKIDYVSVEEGFIVILAGPIYQVCYDRNGKQLKATGIGNISLEQTPFSFSSRNNLVATGCNYRLVGKFSNLSVSETTSCYAFCDKSSDTIDCPRGVACCKAPMPMTMNATREFTLNFEKIEEQYMGEEDGTCSAAFFLAQDEEVIMAARGGIRRPLPLKDMLLPAGDHRMILDWAVGRGKCSQASHHNLARRYCNNMSECIDAPSGAGRLCKCHAGYEGNPYAPGGCVDIDECRASHSNNCTFQKLCHNTDGGFTCPCPHNWTGDGYKTGTSCTGPPSPSGSPTQQAQGLNVCDHPEKNPCTYSAHCSDEQGVVECECPPGMSGNGWKRGPGCQKHFPIENVLAVGLALVVLISTAALCYCWIMKRRQVRRKRAELFRKNGGLLLQQRFTAIKSQGKDSSAKIFSEEELKAATNNYNETRILGRGASGTVYKGVLPDETVVAVKKSRVFDESQVEQFVNEITILSQTDHPNVVKLLGCCLETEVPLLVYEFVPNGTLFQHIHNRSAPRSLTWEDTLRIAAETAEALAYLHSTSSIPIIHRDIKSSNILLDENFVAKISDFGASRSVPFDQTHVTTLVQGTIGYLDPEYFQSSQLTEKSDVYSFGVVLAELLTRQKPISLGRPEESCNLAMHIVIMVNEGRLLKEIEPQILAEAGEEQLHAVAHLSVRCLNMNGQERPIMNEVASVLEELRRSFRNDKEQTMRRKDEPAQKSNEQGHLLREASSTSSLHYSEGSTQLSMEAEMKASCHTPR